MRGAASPAEGPASRSASCAIPSAIPPWQSSPSSSRAAGCTSLALAFFTPPLEWDSLTYHLPRAVVLAARRGSADTSRHANDPRLNGNPPGGEIGLLWTMALSGGDRLVALPQLAAASALVVGVVGIAGRIGLSARSALLGGLLFASLPLVAVQASTTYNDLVVASFLVIAAYASIGRARSELVLLALAIGLALTTKFTGILALPGARPRRGGGEPDSALAGARRGRTRRDRARFAVVHRQPRRDRPFRRSADERHRSGAGANTARDRTDDPAGALLLRRFLRDTRDRPVPVAVSVHHDRRDLRAPRAPRARRRSSVGNRSRPDEARPGSRRRSRSGDRSPRCPCRRRRPVPPGLARVLARRRQAGYRRR